MPDSLAATLATLFPLVYFFRAVRGRIILCPDDGMIFNVPLRVAASKILLDGSLPLWNPYIFSGMPLFGSAQGGLLFPLNWLYLGFDAATATNMMVISTYMVAALGAYLYARRSGSDLVGAIVTSLAWQCGSFLVAQIGHINIVQVAAMLPWVLWALDGYAANGRHCRGLLLAVLVTLQVFVGHPQTLCYSILLVSAYAVVMALADKEARARYFKSLALIATGLALAALQILPTFEMLRNSTRTDVTHDFFTSFSMPRRFIQTFLAPYVVGGGDGYLFRAPYTGPPFYAEYVGYVGLLTLMLALVALLLKRDPRNLFWAATVVICLALALGGNAPFGLSKLIYHVPILNLFRVPARHLMETTFALAVLAGRGMTLLAEYRRETWAIRRTLAVGAALLVLTCLAVTWGRPPEFRLGREAPVSFLRAPELFIPVAIAALSALTLWVFARGRIRGASAILLTVLALDLGVWGQSSGWRLNTGPAPGSEYWNVPETVQFLGARELQDKTPYRILTVPHTFDPARVPVPPSVSHSPNWVLWTQPDIYMMHKIENAAGYDGFGMARYSRLAGDMKVWGELTDPNRTLRGASREIDLLNVRYLVSMRRGPDELDPADKPTAFEPATQEFGGNMFAQRSLGIPDLGAGQRLLFSVPPVEADRIGLITSLAWSLDVPDGAVVAHVRLQANDGRTFDLPLRAGSNTAEWSYDRPDTRSRIRHSRSVIAMTYSVEDAQGEYEAHSYVTSLALPEKLTIRRGEIAVERFVQSPKLLLGVQRLSFVDGTKAYPLRAEWTQVGEESEEPEVAQQPSASQPVGKSDDRWRLLGQTQWVDIYENARRLPRAWLVSGEIVLSAEKQIEAIRTGKLPGGESWHPLQAVLVETTTGIAFRGGQSETSSAEVMRHEPNRVEVKTTARNPTLLVLSENHYPGWRARVDGRTVEILRVNYNLRGVALEPGEHVVEFIYRPRSVLAGAIISMLTLAGLLLWSSRVVQLRRRNR